MELISRDKAIVQLSHNKIGDDDCDVVIQRDIATVQGVPSAFERMTNGEVIQALFPNINVRDTSVENLIATDLDGDYLIFTREWWDAPYQKGGE